MMYSLTVKSNFEWWFCSSNRKQRMPWRDTQRHTRNNLHIIYCKYLIFIYIYFDISKLYNTNKNIWADCESPTTRLFGAIRFADLK